MSAPTEQEHGRSAIVRGSLGSAGQRRGTAAGCDLCRRGRCRWRRSPKPRPIALARITDPGVCRAARRACDGRACRQRLVGPAIRAIVASVFELRRRTSDVPARRFPASRIDRRARPAARRAPGGRAGVAVRLARPRRPLRTLGHRPCDRGAGNRPRRVGEASPRSRRGSGYAAADRLRTDGRSAGELQAPRASRRKAAL